MSLLDVGINSDGSRQFKGDKFVDGLLGICSAGGQTSGADSAQLASRLTALRQERAKRKVITKVPTVAAAAVEDASPTFNHVAPQGAAPPKRANNSAKRKKRKKKKGKR